MFVDIAKYKWAKNLALNYFETRGGRDIQRSISMCAFIYGVPAIAIAYWLGEATNWDPVAVNSIKRLKAFYDYDEVVNKPPGSPV